MAGSNLFSTLIIVSADAMVESNQRLGKNLVRRTESKENQVKYGQVH